MDNKPVRSITFIVPIGDEDVYRKCFLSSPLFQGGSDFQILGQTGFKTAAEAYNNGLDQAVNDVIVCLHQDVMLPAGWATRLRATLDDLDSQGLPVGVVGCMGITSRGEPAGHIYRHDRELHPRRALPARVETLDEMLVCFRKSSGLRFDPHLPSFFAYAVDICLQARSRGLENFAVDAPCFHQTKNRNGLPKEFYAAWVYVLEKWKDLLPIRTLSGTLDNKRSYWLRRLKQSLFDMIGYSPAPWWRDLPRINPEEILSTDTVPTRKE